MGIWRKINDAISRPRATRKIATQETTGRIRVNPLCSSYENIFAQVRPLIDEMKTVLPYGVGRNGAKLPLARTPELLLLQTPNDQMGWSEFADLMFATWLTEPQLYVHVWKNQRGKIFGYSVLPLDSRVNLGNGEYDYQIIQSDGQTVRYEPDEVMVLRYSRNPQDIEQGVSPASSAFVWSQVDDLLAQYQKAYLENGAIPASVTIIRASTHERYEKVRKELEGQLKGASNRNKTIYLWKQMLDDGEEKDQVEVKPIQGNNSTLAIKEIMSIVNDKLNKAFGVSEFILGNDSSAKYDNAELSDRQFTKRRVYPALLAFWSQFQHELDRVLGGLGYGINFDLEIPELTDRLKVKAEISEKNVTNLTNLLMSGAAPLAAVKALNLGDEWLAVASGIVLEKEKQAELQATAASVPPVALAEPATADKVPMIEHICKHHDCHHSHSTKDKAMDYTPVFTEDEVIEERVYDELSAMMDAIVTKALGEEAAKDQETIEEAKRLIVMQLVQSANLGADEGAKEIQAQVLGDTADEIASILENGGFHVNEDFQKRLAQRVDKISERFQGEVQTRVSDVLNKAREQKLTQQQLRKELEDVMPKYQAERIARNETVYAFRAGHLENDKYIAQKYGLKLRKVWRCTKDAESCPICKAMDGQTVEISEAFPDSVESNDGIRYGWEHSSWNENGEIPSAHVNCRCHFETEVVDE